MSQHHITTDLHFPSVIKVFSILIMVDLTIAARREPPTCIKGTISEYERRLILFFFEEINNLTLMSGKVEFGCHFLQIITCSRIVCIILNQQIPPPRI
ncbi:hypothetical protein ANCCAN_28061 [Ancylostoma caninum]|uniref:Uncharacterized protein n=1 Tax=Ancylostoma caninum TaxID=29170 RepID=A0A368F5D6_ANCCA|nr:hypothetical protein ANCCAN_28061 [Ancylostoma caninum]